LFSKHWKIKAFGLRNALLIGQGISQPCRRMCRTAKSMAGERNGVMNTYRFVALSLAAGLAVAGATGCATKNYVRNETAPLVDRTNQLDSKTAANNRQIHDVDDRAQSGIRQAQGSADAATTPARLPATPNPRPTQRCIAPTRWRAW
jgi:hypothetical protein